MNDSHDQSNAQFPFTDEQAIARSYESGGVIQFEPAPGNNSVRQDDEKIRKAQQQQAQQ